MPIKSNMLRSLVKHFVTRARNAYNGTGIGLAGGRRRRRVGGSIRRTIKAYQAPARTGFRARFGMGRRHRGGALRLAGQRGSMHGPVHVGVSKMGLTNLPQAY